VYEGTVYPDDLKLRLNAEVPYSNQRLELEFCGLTFAQRMAAFLVMPVAFPVDTIGEPVWEPFPEAVNDLISP
jgi:hypothetical protein